MLYTFTVAVNLIALAIAIWLGIYVVSHAPRSAIAWLTGLTLWSIAGFFLNFLLAVNPPPSPAMVPWWALPLLWFWPEGAFQHGWGVWLQGWQINLAIVFWHHVTVLLRPKPMTAGRWARVLLGYAAAIVAIVGERYTTLVFTASIGNPLYLAALVQGPLFPLYMSALILFTALALINLARSAASAPTLLERKQLRLMAIATIIGGMAGPVAFISYRLHLAFPRVIITLLLAGGVFMFGYAVARYSALIEGRVIGRDLLYSGLSVLLVSGLYLMVAWSSVAAYGVPLATVVIVMILAIVTHSLVDAARHVFDLVFYRREARQLRERLRNLAQQVYESEPLEVSLANALETICEQVSASYGLILLFRGEEVSQAASYHWRRGSIGLHSQDLCFEDVMRLPVGRFQPPLEEAALLVPLYAGEEQEGALILGRPDNAVSYSKSDIERLLDASDRIADAIHEAQKERANLIRLVQLAEVQAPRLELEEGLQPKVVEDALRNLFNHAYLADTPLADSPLTRARLPQGELTHLERGKAVQRAVLDGLEHMRPGAEIPRDTPSREWYPYLILRDAYLNGVSNRDIMLKLYISEGTFNRTRRAAIRSLARTLSEMEAVAERIELSMKN